MTEDRLRRKSRGDRVSYEGPGITSLGVGHHPRRNGEPLKAFEEGVGKTRSRI